MSTPIGFERWEPGHPWGDVVYSDGSRSSVADPDGSIEADARRFGAQYNAQPAPPRPPQVEPPLSGAAAPTLAPSTPSPDVPPAPPLPSGAPLSAAERAPLVPSAADLAPLQQPAPGARPSLPSTGQSVTARVLADNGVDPGSLPRAGAPGGMGMGSDPSGISPALAAVQQHAPQLLPSKGDVKYEGPDQQTAEGVRAASDLALTQRGQGITDLTQAKGLGVQTEAGAANEAYFAGWQQQQQALGATAAAQKARDEAASKLYQVKQTPIADHPDFPDWFVAASILGGIAGGFNQGFTGGAYKSTTVDNLTRLIGDWRENQRYNKSNLVATLEQQLGDRDAALGAASAKLKESFAQMADAKARFARTPAAMAELKATADTMRAQALDEWGKTQTLVMGKASESLSLAPGKGGASNVIQARLRALGITPEQYTKGLDGKVSSGDNSPTIAQAATATKQIDADIALLESIKAANGGTLPTKGVINIPQALIPTLSKLGYQPGMAAEQTNGLINTYLTQKAKGYGGTITQSDRESAALEYGVSGDGFMRGLQRLRDTNNNGIRTALSQHFPGAGQQVLDVLLDDSASYGGVPSPPTAPFEKQNVAPAGPRGEQPMQPNAALNVSPEEQARIDAEVAKGRAAEDKARAEREAEVARRQERPIPGSKF
jgi:hypothetical protein